MHDQKHSRHSVAYDDSRDATQSRLSHEPTFRISNIDPMTGNDIKDAATHPWIEDGNLKIYFETADTRQAYIDMAFKHSYLRSYPFKLQTMPIGVDDGVCVQILIVPSR